MDIRKEFEDWYEKHHNGRQIDCDYIQEENSYSSGYANAQWVSWQAAKSSVAEGFVLTPRLSANYLFNTVPELGFAHQDLKDTVLYHLNYMASNFRDSAKQFVLDDHAQQKAMIEAQEPSNPVEIDRDTARHKLAMMLRGESTEINGRTVVFNNAGCFDVRQNFGSGHFSQSLKATLNYLFGAVK